MKAEIKGNTLIITLPLQEPKASSSGKTMIIAGTGGFAATDVQHKGKAVKISVNAIIDSK